MTSSQSGHYVPWVIKILSVYLVSMLTCVAPEVMHYCLQTFFAALLIIVLQVLLSYFQVGDNINRTLNLKNHFAQYFDPSKLSDQNY